MNNTIYENERLSIVNGKKTFYGLISIFFGLTFLFFITSVILTTYFFNFDWLYRSWWGYGILMVGLVFLVIFSWSTRRHKIKSLPLNFLFYFITVIFLTYLVSYIARVSINFSKNESLIIFGSLLIPGVIMVAAGILGYFELIKINKIITVYIFLFFVYVITAIISLVLLLVVGGSQEFWNIRTLLNLLIIFIAFLSTVINIYSMRKQAEAFEMTTDKSELVREALSYSLSLFINYVQMVLMLLEIFGGGRRK